jgi:hypothetical protein
MSQAVIEFCDGLKSTLLSIEDRVERALDELRETKDQTQVDVKKHLEEAAKDLSEFRSKAAHTAQMLRADLPEKSVPLRQKLQEFGDEAQLAMRHAVVFLAEAAAVTAEGASHALKTGSERARALAANVKHQDVSAAAKKQLISDQG